MTFAIRSHLRGSEKRSLGLCPVVDADHGSRWQHGNSEPIRQEFYIHSENDAQSAPIDVVETIGCAPIDNPEFAQSAMEGAFRMGFMGASGEGPR